MEFLETKFLRVEELRAHPPMCPHSCASGGSCDIRGVRVQGDRYQPEVRKAGCSVVLHQDIYLEKITSEPLFPIEQAYDPFQIPVNDIHTMQVDYAPRDVCQLSWVSTTLIIIQTR